MTTEFVEVRLSRSSDNYRVLQGTADTDVPTTYTWTDSQPVLESRNGVRGIAVDFYIPPEVNFDVGGTMPTGAYWEVGFNFTIETGETVPPSIDAISTSNSQINIQASSVIPLYLPVDMEAQCFRSLGASSYASAPAAAIPDAGGGTLSDFLFIDEQLLIEGNTTIRASISHSWRGDLSVDLISPSGRFLNLYQGDPLDFTPNLNINVTTGVFAGESAYGSWQLRVTDNQQGSTGTLNNWSLQFTGQESFGARVTSNFSGAASFSLIGPQNGAVYACRVRQFIGPEETVETTDWSPTRNVLVGEPPSRPTISSIEGLDSAVEATINANTLDGLPITEYSLTCVSNQNENSGSSDSARVRVEDLFNDVGYLCTATAANALGISPPSASVKVFPEELVDTGLPIWLLYEITKN